MYLDDPEDVEYIKYEGPVVVGLGSPGDLLLDFLKEHEHAELGAEDIECMGHALKADLTNLYASLDFEKAVCEVVSPLLNILTRIMANEMRTRIPPIREVTDLDVECAKAVNSDGTINLEVLCHSDLPSEKIRSDAAKIFKHCSVALNPSYLEQVRAVVEKEDPSSDIQWTPLKRSRVL